MTERTSDISDWITPGTDYIIHLDTAILYKEEPTVSVPAVELLEVSQNGVILKTPVDAGEDTAPVNEKGGKRHYPYESVSNIEFLK